eukprot:6210225-Pleurochrysis_carterae.AAC.4
MSCAQGFAFGFACGYACECARESAMSLCRLLLQCLALRLVGGHREARTNGCAALPRTRERSDLAREPARRTRASQAHYPSIHAIVKVACWLCSRGSAPGPLQELKRRRLGRGEGLSSERVLCGLRGLLILDARWRVRRRMRTCKTLASSTLMHAYAKDAA